MEIKVDISRLNSFLGLAHVILSEKKVPEDMRFVKINASDTTLVVTVLNTQCCMRKTWYDVISSEPFECLVYASTFISLIKKLSGEVTLSFTDDKKLTITHATGRKEMTWAYARSFPMVFEISGEHLDFNSKNLASTLNKAEEFVLNDDFSPVFRYVAIEINDKDVSVVSSDKFQLYICKMANDKGYKGMFVTISQTIVNILSKMLKGLDCNIKIYLTEKITFIEIGDVVLYNINPEQKMYNWRYIDERFQGDVKIVFNTNKVLGAIDRCYTPSSNESYMYITKTKCFLRESSFRGDETSIEYFEPDLVEGLNMDMVDFRKPILDLKRSINCLDGDKFIMEIQLPNKFLKIYSPDNLNEYLYLSTYNN